MKNKLFWALVIGVGLFLLRKINWGQITWRPAELITVTGEARSQEANQVSSFTAGVNAVNDDKDRAVREVSDKLKTITESVKKFGIADGDIKTQNINIYQEESQYWDNGVQKSRKGQWRVDNSIEIILREVEKAGKLADLLTSSGANNVWGPNFRIEDTSEAEKELFDGAMEDAREKAGIVAKAAGRGLGKVVSVTEGLETNNIYPLRGDMGGGGTPVEGGSTTVSKTITVVFEMR